MDKLRAFQNHPFQIKDDESMQALCDSIKEYGVLSPLLARPTADGKYEIVSGHRRKAAAMKLEAIKHQGERNDLTCDQVGHRSDGKKSVQIIADNSSDSKTQIQRYIRLTYLEKPILDLVDAGRIAFSPAVELSYLTRLEQAELWDIMQSED